MTDELRHKPGHLVWRAYQLTWSLFADECGPLDITPVQEALLLVLASSPGIDQKTLAELVALDRSTAGNVIGRLEERGLIERVRNNTDRRARKLSLTPRGVAMSRKLRPIAMRAAKRLLTSLGPLERPEFMRLLRKVTNMADPLDMVGPSPTTACRLDGIRMLIVGLGDGFGREITERIEAQGAQIAEVRALLPQGCADPEFADALKFAVRKLGRVDVLLNGGSVEGELLQLGRHDEAQALIQGLAAARLTTIMGVLPHFMACGAGRIINLAVMPNVGIPPLLMTAVIAANAAIVALTREVANDYRPSGIVANCISPRLERTVHADAKKSSSSFNKVAHIAPVDVAATAIFLASADARFVTSTDLVLG